MQLRETVVGVIDLAERQGLSCTPSVHVTNKDGVDMFAQEKGFGEKLEDLVEQCHQKMNRLHMRLAGLGSTKRRADALSRM